jgi:hypothetical protein
MFFSVFLHGSYVINWIKLSELLVVIAIQSRPLSRNPKKRPACAGSALENSLLALTSSIGLYVLDFLKVL